MRMRRQDGGDYCSYRLLWSPTGSERAVLPNPVGAPDERRRNSAPEVQQREKRNGGEFSGPLSHLPLHEACHFLRGRDAGHRQIYQDGHRLDAYMDNLEIMGSVGTATLIGR